MPYCRDCGKSIEDDWLTCPYCSHAVDVVSKPNHKSSGIKNEVLINKNSKYPETLDMFLFLMILILGVFLFDGHGIFDISRFDTLGYNCQEMATDSAQTLEVDWNNYESSQGFDQNEYDSALKSCQEEQNVIAFFLFCFIISGVVAIMRFINRDSINRNNKRVNKDSKKKKRLVLKSKFKNQNNKQVDNDSNSNSGWSSEAVGKSKKQNNIEKSGMVVDLTKYFDKFCNQVRNKTSHDENRLQKLEELIQIYLWSRPTIPDDKSDDFYTIVQIIHDIFAIAPVNFSSIFANSEYFEKYHQIYSDPMKLNQVQRKAYFVLINQILKLGNWD